MKIVKDCNLRTFKQNFMCVATKMTEKSIIIKLIQLGKYNPKKAPLGYKAYINVANIRNECQIMFACQPRNESWTPAYLLDRHTFKN